MMDAFADLQDSELDDDTRRAFHRDVIDGLSRPVKTLPCKWLYDVRGSELFEEITQLDEYYPTRTELALLAGIADEIGAALPGNKVHKQASAGRGDSVLSFFDVMHAVVAAGGVEGLSA